MFPSMFSELFEILTLLFKKAETFIKNCCATPHTRPYTVHMFVQQPLMHKLLDHV